MATGTLLTTRVISRVVPFWIERLIALAGTVPGKSDDEGSAEMVDGVSMEGSDGVWDGCGVAHPANAAQSMAMANGFMVNQTMRVPRWLGKASIVSPVYVCSSATTPSSCVGSAAITLEPVADCESPRSLSVITLEPTDHREAGSSEADPATLGGHKSEMGNLVILPKIRDPRFITVRRGGSLQDDDHRLLAMWAADCAEHVLHHFEQARPKDDRPRRAIDLGRAWARGEITWWEARTAGGHANAAARDLSGAARHAAYAAGQAAAVGHVAAHELGAAAYAIKAARAAAPEDEREAAGRLECQWQRAQLPHEIRELVLDDQRLRNELCWFAFDC